MITEEIIRKEFVHQTISYGIRKIYSIQEEVISSTLKSVSGDLLSWVRNRRFDFDDKDARSAYYISVLPYLRFLDISYRRNPDRISRHIRSKLALYNRAVWGVLYGETFPALKYGYRDNIRQYMRERLENALPVDPDELALLVDY